MRSYTLEQDGDDYEKKYWDLFLSSNFPSYGIFWSSFIVPLTNRPKNIHFKTDGELKKENRGQHDICNAQLHYTVFRHLTRAYDFKQIDPLETEQFTEAITRLCSALDVADELLERFANPMLYDPWSEKDGQKARYAWRQKHNSLQYLRDYRNKLLHGRVTPSIAVLGTYVRYRVPKFNKVDEYLDWRKVTNASIGSGGKVRNDFDAPNNLLDSAWDEVIQYLENSWKKFLLGNKSAT